jgi:hypothetical protein
MTHALRTIFISITLLLTACSATAFHVGNDFDVMVFSNRVTRGTTSQTEVRSWLGVPASTGVRVETDGARYEEWTYYFAAGTLSNVSGTQLKSLQIKYDTRGIVQGYNWSIPSH